MNVELRHLRYFVAVAEEASFTSAARRVHVAQQVLSTQIRQLEEAVFVLPSDHALAGRGQLTLADVAGLRWIAASPATDGCDPATWRDAWLLVPVPAATSRSSAGTPVRSRKCGS